MSYYSDQIKLYRSTTSFTTGIREAIHITQIKDLFKQTNMKKGYKKQILNHNVEKFSLMIKANLNIVFSVKTLIQADQNAALQINPVSNAKKLLKI